MNNFNFIMMILLLITQVATSVMPIAGRGFIDVQEGSMGSLVLLLLSVPFLYIIIIANFFKSRKLDSIAIYFLIFFAYMAISGLTYFIPGYPFKDVLRAIVFASTSIAFFLAAYYATMNSVKVQKYLPKLYLVYFAISVVIFVILLRDNMSYVHVRQVKETYMMFLIFPWILIAGNAVVRNAGIVLVGLLAVFSRKRGAVLDYVLAVPTFFFVKNFFIENRYKFLYIFGTPVFIASIFFILYYFSGDTLDLVIERFNAIGDDGGSGRSDMYALTWDLFLNEDFLYKIVGSGYYYIKMNIQAFYVHNDFLEILVSYGIIGFGLLCLILIAMIRHCIFLIRTGNRFAPAFAASIVIYFIMMNISVVYFGVGANSSFFAFFGYIFATTGRAGLPEAEGQYHPYLQQPSYTNYYR